MQNRFGGLVLSAGKELVKQTWVRNNDKTKARAEERREKNIGWIGRLFTAEFYRKALATANTHDSHEREFSTWIIRPAGWVPLLYSSPAAGPGCATTCRVR